MQAFGVQDYGDRTHLTTLTVPTPTLKPKQVLLEVRAVGINPYDIQVRNGSAAKSRPLTLPVIPGSDVVGKVVKIGSAVDQWQVGDLLIGKAAIGGYADYVAVGQKMAVKLPEKFSLTTAAAIPTTGVTAYDLVVTAMRLQPGQTVAVIGAGGNVGSLVVQLAQYAGAKVIALASSKQHDFLTELGVETILDYQNPVASQIAATADWVVNAVNGGGQLQLAEQLVKPSGQILTLGPVPTDFEAEPVAVTAFNDAQYHQNQPALTVLTKLAAAGKLQIRVGKKLDWSLANLKLGQQLIEDHQVAGKVVLVKS